MYLAYIAYNAMRTKKISTKCHVFLQLYNIASASAFYQSRLQKNLQNHPHFTFENLQVRKSAFYQQCQTNTVTKKQYLFVTVGVSYLHCKKYLLPRAVYQGTSQLATWPTRHTLKSCNELTIISDSVVTSSPYFLT